MIYQNICSVKSKNKTKENKYRKGDRRIDVPCFFYKCRKVFDKNIQSKKTP